MPYAFSISLIESLQSCQISDLQITIGGCNVLKCIRTQSNSLVDLSRSLELTKLSLRRMSEAALHRE